MLHLHSIGIRFKLIAIFILIKVLPLVVLAWMAWSSLNLLGFNVAEKINQLSADSRETITDISKLSVESSIRALDLKSREAIERLSTDTARAVASFLYARDNDILLAATLPPSEENYRTFLAPLTGRISQHRPWKLNAAGDAWVPQAGHEENSSKVTSRNKDNAKDFHSRAPGTRELKVKRPLFLEMTFVDLMGNEQVKFSTSDILSKEKRNISVRANTYCKAENYFEKLKKLSPGEIYVSEVIGPYLKSPIIGPYTKVKAQEKGILFEPENAAYAGKENPVGKRFQGIVRWATPVVQNGHITGYVTLALDHTHIMEFTDHIVPTAERYTDIPDASSGNYAFIWDYKDRNISHPRDYFIVGYDPETGEPAVPWLAEGMYEDFVQSKESISQWEKTAPVFKNQSLEKKPSPELTDAGLIGLDCRYLNFAPQCDGWNNLTKDGGSGSFVILWSGLWKLTTAAAIPYHTGIYSGKRGFGFVTIGANVHEFHKAATETGEKIEGMAADFQGLLKKQNEETQHNLYSTQAATSKEIIISTLVMVALVILIAIWMASTLTRKITDMIKGIRIFQNGSLDHRFKIDSGDEVGQLASAFNDMSDDVQKLITDLRQAEEKYRGFFENATEGIFRSTVEGRLVNVNPAFARLMGYDSVEDILSNINDIASDLYVDPNRRKEMLREMKLNGSVHDFEYEVKLSSGGTRFLTSYTRMVTGDDGQQYLEGMATDVSERKFKEKAEIEKEAALEANKSKSEFLANMSHEIRTPLNAILGMTEMLSESELTDEQRKYVSLFKSSGESLLQLINEILDFSKIEAGQMILGSEAFDLPELLNGMADIMRLLATKNGLEFECNIDESTPDWVKGDKLRLKQVLMNLLGNAIKFTNEGSVKMWVSADQKSDQNVQVAFYIEDTGVGIEQDKMGTIFDSFTQADSSSTRKYSGTGLGLTISKRLVELMSGSIDVVSRKEVGTSFAVTLPFIVASSACDKNAETVRLPDSIAGDNKPKNILVVEDSASNRMLLTHYLQDTGHKLIMSENGEEGFHAYQEQGNIDVILMDMQMPVMDGIEATKAIRTYEKTNDISPVQIVALTANAFADDEKQCLNAGCDSYMSKPVSRGDLLALLGDGLSS